jgi:ATP-dependent Clp protease, protease subunit
MMNLPPELQAALLDRRVIFLRGRLDEQMSSGVIAQLLLVGRIAEGRTIELYVDSPGGSLATALSLYDVIRTLGPRVSTTCLGTAAGAAVLIVAAGAAGQRFALPHARLHLSEDPTGLDLKPDTADEATRIRERWLQALVSHTGHSAEHIARDLHQGRWLSAAEARDYGLVDGIIPSIGRG